MRVMYADTAEGIVSDGQLESAFAGTNFGVHNPREILVDTLWKNVLGFSTGHTALRIAQDLKLIGRGRDTAITKRGRRYLYLASKITVRQDVGNQKE